MTSFINNCRKVVCVGRNYVAHIKELNNAIPSKPMLFLKPPSTFITQGEKIEIPVGCTNLHHEVELGVVIGKKGRDIPPTDVSDHIKGYFLGLDMTAREIQDQAKKKGHPWSVAKGYDTFLPVSSFIEKQQLDHNNCQLWLKVVDTNNSNNNNDNNNNNNNYNNNANGDGGDGGDESGIDFSDATQFRQYDSTSLMMFPVEHLISYISTIFTLEEGDCILTGTPAGVGKVTEGQVIHAGIRGISESTISFVVTQRKPPQAFTLDHQNPFRVSKL